MLYMKGTPEAPQCGFSAQASAILNSYNIDYHSFDVLTDDGIRNGIKEYADSSFANEPKCKSTSGYSLLKNKGAISWRTKKQTIVTDSPTNAKYVALAEARKRQFG